MKHYINEHIIYALRNNSYDRDILRILAKDIPTIHIFEACANNEITSEEGAYLMMLQRESEYWIVRVLQYWYKEIFG